MYCAEHYPGRLALFALARRAVLQIPGLELREVYHISEADAVKARVRQEYRDTSRLEVIEQRTPYNPVTLPSLPRMACPVREIAWNKTGQQVIHPCKRRVTENGFCQEHQLS